VNKKEGVFGEEFCSTNLFPRLLVDNVETVLVLRVPFDPVTERLTLVDDRAKNLVKTHDIWLLDENNVVFCQPKAAKIKTG
jgi:hypothetical protein